MSFSSFQHYINEEESVCGRESTERKRVKECERHLDNKRMETVRERETE